VIRETVITAKEQCERDLKIANSSFHTYKGTKDKTTNIRYKNIVTADDIAI